MGQFLFKQKNQVLLDLGTNKSGSSMPFDLGPIAQLNKEIARDWTIKAVFKKVNRFQWIQPLMEDIEQLL